LVRLGEGEGYVGAMPASLRIEFEMHWWGAPEPPQLRGLLRNKLQLAIASADMLGVPSDARVWRDFRRAENSRVHGGFRVLSDYLSTFDGLGITWVDTEMWWAGSALKPFRLWANLAKRVIVVGPRARLKKWFEAYRNPEERDVVFIPVPPHKNSSEPRDDGKPRILHRIGELESAVKDAVGPGDLLLVGAGVAGKHLVQVGKAQGAVALDVGHALPAFLRSHPGWGF
jgi:hypothetical protein